MRNFIVSLFLLFAGMSLAGARTCRILFLGAPAGAPEKLFLFGGKETQEVELPQMNLSPVYELPAGELVLRMLAARPATPEAVDPAAPRLTVPEGVSDFYLLVSSDPSNKVAPVTMRLIDADATKFKAGQMLWFNLTENSVGGLLGKQKLALAPNSKTVVDAPTSGNEDYLANLSFRMPGNKDLYPLCETKWHHDPRSRTIIFVLNQQGNRTPRVLGFPDFRSAEKKEKSLAEE